MAVILRRPGLEHHPEVARATSLAYDEADREAKEHLRARSMLLEEAARLETRRSEIRRELDGAHAAYDSIKQEIAGLQAGIDTHRRRIQEPSSGVEQARADLDAAECIPPIVDLLLDIGEEVRKSRRLSADQAVQLYDTIAEAVLPRVNAVREAAGRLARKERSEQLARTNSNLRIAELEASLGKAAQSLDDARAVVDRVESSCLPELASVEERIAATADAISEHERLRAKALERRGPRHSVRIRS